MVTKLITFMTFVLASSPVLSSEVRHAIIHLDGFGHGVLITDSPLGDQASVDIQYPSGQLNAACCKRLTATDFSKASPDSVLTTNEMSGEQPFVYRVRIPKLWAETAFIGMAAFGQGIKTRNIGDQLESIDNRGRTRRSNICTSHEGVHLTDGAGKTMRTHLYLSLGYELETISCPSTIN